MEPAPGKFCASSVNGFFVCFVVVVIVIPASYGLKATFINFKVDNLDNWIEVLKNNFKI